MPPEYYASGLAFKITILVSPAGIHFDFSIHFSSGLVLENIKAVHRNSTLPFLRDVKGSWGHTVI